MQFRIILNLACMEISVGQRLGIFLKCSKISQIDFAKSLGTSRTSISAIVSGSRPLTSGMIARILEMYPQVNRIWLLEGKGDMTTNEAKIILKPHYPASVKAGVLGGEPDSVNEQQIEQRPLIPSLPNYEFTIDVEGDSMEPTYYNSDVVACRWIESSSQIKQGEVYVILTREGAVIKRIMSQTLSSIKVFSDNESVQSPYRIDKDDIIKIAEVVGSIHTNQETKNKAKEAQRRTLVEFASRGEDDELIFDGITAVQNARINVSAWVRAAGINKHITFHCGRHTFAVMMLDLGVDLYTVSKLLGHKSIETTQIYAKVLDKNKLNAVDRIPNFI